MSFFLSNTGFSRLHLIYFITYRMSQRTCDVKPVTPELRPQADLPASLNNVKDQDKRCRVTYSAIATQWHFL